MEVKYQYIGFDNSNCFTCFPRVMRHSWCVCMCVWFLPSHWSQRVDPLFSSRGGSPVALAAGRRRIGAGSSASASTSPCLPAEPSECPCGSGNTKITLYQQDKTNSLSRLNITEKNVAHLLHLLKYYLPVFDSPGGHLIRHHDLVVMVGHHQPEGLLENIFNEILSLPFAWAFGLWLATFRVSLVPCFGFGLRVVLHGVDAAEVLAGVAAPYVVECRNG